MFVKLDNDSSLAFTECGFDKALVLRLNSQNTDCISLDTAKKWEKYGILEIISESNNWFYIRYNGRTGYVYKSLIKP